MRRREGGDDEQFTWRVCGEGENQSDGVVSTRCLLLLYAEVSGWNYKCYIIILLIVFSFILLCGAYSISLHRNG